jgi:hypothetical protein
MMPPLLVAPFMPTAALSLVSPATSEEHASDDDFLIWDEHDVAAGKGEPRGPKTLQHRHGLVRIN